MTQFLPKVIDGLTVATAWCRAFEYVYSVSTSRVQPLVVSIGDGCTDPLQDTSNISGAIDIYLASQSTRLTCKDVASTIFPDVFTDSGDSAKQSFDRWRRAFPRLQRRAGKKHLTCNRYHHRMVAYGQPLNTPGCDQLMRIIERWNSGAHNSMLFQVALLDPIQDHTNDPRPKFPCLQQLGFTMRRNPDGYDLSVNAFYPAQNIVQRAFGNYYGLCQLGSFMASHMSDCTFVTLNCYVARPTRGAGVAEVVDLKTLVQRHLNISIAATTL